MNIYFSGDYHFTHKGMLTFGGRPFENTYYMNQSIINNHNKIVKPNDHFYHGGDLSFGGLNKTIELLKQLNGKIHLILGNHDKVLRKPEILNHVVWVKERYNLTIQVDKQVIVLDHYAGKVWNKSHWGSVQLYSHSHGNLEETPGMLQMDIGIDAIAKRLSTGGTLKPEDYRPIAYDEVKIIMEAKKNERNM